MVKEKLEVYKCNVCGNIIEVLIVGSGELVCCEQPMELQQEKTDGEGGEKHIPVIEKTETGVKVTIGQVPHVMEEKHYIQLIEVITDDNVYHKFLSPGDEPITEFEITADKITAREYCNVHGLWKA